MQDVEYPVWAQPNVGPGTMMMPGDEDYIFKNAESNIKLFYAL